MSKLTKKQLKQVHLELGSAKLYRRLLKDIERVRHYSFKDGEHMQTMYMNGAYNAIETISALAEGREPDFQFIFDARAQNAPSTPVLQ